MLRNDYPKELNALLGLMQLGPGDHFLDAQGEPDNFIFTAAERIAPYGRAVSLSYGEKTVRAIVRKIQKEHVENATVYLGHINKLPFPKDQFGGVLYRKTRNIHSPKHVFEEALRVCKPGAQIVVCHLQWTLEGADDGDDKLLKAIDDLNSSSFKTGMDFVNQFKTFPWRESSFDIYCLASNDKQHKQRYAGDWRALFREILTCERYYPPEDAQALISLIDEKEITVKADRYLGVGRTR